MSCRRRAAAGGGQQGSGAEVDVPYRIAWSDQFHLFVGMRDVVKVRLFFFIFVWQIEVIEMRFYPGLRDQAARPERGQGQEPAGALRGDFTVRHLIRFSLIKNDAFFTLSSFPMDESWVCGVAPYEKRGLVAVLTVAKKKGSSSRPQVTVAEPLEEENEDGEMYKEVSADVLSVRGHDRYRPGDYHFACLWEEANFLVIGRLVFCCHDTKSEKSTPPHF